MFDILKRITIEEMTPLKANQNRTEGSRNFGGVVLPENGFAEPTHSGHAIEGLYGLYLTGDSPWSDEDLEQSITLLLDHLVTRQHDDGTQDLMSTNFHDTSSTAFAIQYLYYSFLLASEREDSLSRVVAERLTGYFEKGITALAYGGFHTPNHRWVISSAIIQLLLLLEREKISAGQEDEKALRETLKEYLGEGIDMDEFGEYTEKSVGVYNIHCNNSLMIMEECNNRLKESFFEPGSLLAKVKKNLDLMPSYLEPDGSLFSAKSTRQDSGYRIYPDPYFINYLVYGYMAKDQAYRETAARLLSLNEYRSRRSMESLCRILYNRNILEGIESSASLEPSEQYFNPRFGLFRKNTATTSITAAAGTPFFFRYKKGGNALAIRLSSSWYGEKGQFIPTGIVRKDDSTIELTWNCTWGYVRPFSEAPPSPEWEKMDIMSREKVHMHTLATTVTIELQEEGCKLNIKMDTDCNVPFKVEAVFSPDGLFSLNRDDVSVTSRGWTDTELIVAGSYTYSLNNTTIAVDGAFSEHSRGSGMRGSEPLVPGSFTVTSTGITPYDRIIRIS